MDSANGHSTSINDGSDGRLTAKEEAIIARGIDTQQKIRLNPPTKLMDVGDEGLCCILLHLFGCKTLRVLRPRALQNMASAYGFIYANSQVLRVFRDIMCKQVREIDTNFPSLIDEDVRTLPKYKQPVNIHFLAKMMGVSLRAVSLPCLLSGSNPTDEYQKPLMLRSQNMMLGISKFCTKLEAITFQDAGILEYEIAERLLWSNPGLKRIVVHSPGTAFLSALTKSDCVLECLMLLNVRPKSFGAALKLLLEKGRTIEGLSIETSPPFTEDDKPTPQRRIHYRRMVKRFTLRFEQIAGEKLGSLSTMVLQPYKEALWYLQFIRRFQRLGRAKLITGSSSGSIAYPPTLAGEVPKVVCTILRLDPLRRCGSEAELRNFLEVVELPDTLCIEQINFFFKFVDRHLNKVSRYVRTAIREKFQHVKNLRLTCSVYSSGVFNEFLEGMGEILDTFEGASGSLQQIERLEIPVDMIPYLVEDRGYKRFITRMSNVREIFLHRPLPYLYLDIETPQALPAFLKCLRKACRELRCLYIASGHHTDMCGDVCEIDLARAKEDALVALDELEEENPYVDVHTVRTQVMHWETS